MTFASFNTLNKNAESVSHHFTEPIGQSFTHLHGIHACEEEPSAIMQEEHHWDERGRKGKEIKLSAK
jgi:hypothetical protein